MWHLFPCVFTYKTYNYTILPSMCPVMVKKNCASIVEMNDELIVMRLYSKEKIKSPYTYINQLF